MAPAREQPRDQVGDTKSGPTYAQLVVVTSIELVASPCASMSEDQTPGPGPHSQGGPSPM